MEIGWLGTLGVVDYYDPFGPGLVQSFRQNLKEVLPLQSTPIADRKSLTDARGKRQGSAPLSRISLVRKEINRGTRGQGQRRSN